MSTSPYTLLVGFLFVIGCCRDCLATNEWRRVTSHPPVPTEKIEPLTGIGPATLSTLRGEQIREVLQYGRLHMFRGIEQKDSAADDAAYKNLLVTVVSHSGHHRCALPWNNRPKLLNDMIETASRSRTNIVHTHQQGVVLLAYADYQRWFMDTHGKEWPQQRAEWKHLLGDAPEDATSFLMRLRDGGLSNAEGGLWSMGEQKKQRVILCLNAPTTLARAKAGIAMDVANGADGSYFDCGGFRDATCYCEHCQAAFAQWLAAHFTVEQRKELFGPATLRDLGRMKTGGEASGQRPRVPPLQLAFTRFKMDATAWFRREIKAYGRSLNPNYLMTSTCWGHDGRPTFWNAQFEKYVGDDGDDFLFWEPGTTGPSSVRALPEATATNQTANAAPDERWGRRSFSPSYRYLHAMARGCPAVSKLAPAKTTTESERARATELMMAEAYANLCSTRTDVDSYSTNAVQKMHRFQDENRNAFVGSKPCTPVAVLVSLNQAVANRKDAAISFLRFLDDLGLESRVILDDQVSESGLKDVECLVLPATDLLSESQLKAIETFRQRGGKLVVFGPAGTRDEWDRERPDGLQRLVGDLAQQQEGKLAVVSRDGKVAFIPLAACPNFPVNMWYRRANDCDPAQLRNAFEGTIGRAWPYLVEAVQSREVHLAQIARGDSRRIVIHVVNYTPTPTKPFSMDVRLPGGFKAKEASAIRPENPTQKTKLELRSIQQHGAAYARLTVPAIEVYGVVAVDCGK